LPPFSEFLDRFDATTNAFNRQYNSHMGNYPLKLCEEHGLAWKDDNPNNLPSVHPECITALQAANHVGSVVVDTMEHHIGDVSGNNSNFIDVWLGYTLMEEAITSNEEVTDVTIMKKDVPLGPHDNSFLLGIHGHFISPHFYRKIIEHVQNDLAFCKSPTGNRMLRVSSEVPGSIFLLSNKVWQCSLCSCCPVLAHLTHAPYIAPLLFLVLLRLQVIETVPMTCLENQLLEVGWYLLQPLNNQLKVHCHENGNPLNPALEFQTDTLQIVVGPLSGAAYSLHNDIDCFNCDDLTTEEEMAQLG
jgi:hypothetical protein